MNQRIYLAVLLSILIFGVYYWYTSPEGFDINSQEYSAADVYKAPVEAPEDRVVVSSPSAPNQRPPKDAPAVIMPEERAFDPQEQNYESAELPERLRHPERMFGPGLKNDSVASAVAAGTASYASQQTDKAYQTFGPEFAQNGGIFMDSVMANDMSLKNDYSSV